MLPRVWDDWSRRPSVLQRRDARAKVVVLLVFLVCVGLSTHIISLVLLAMMLSGGIVAARLPVLPFLTRVLTIAPIPGIFAAAVWISGEPDRAGILLGRSVLSITAILLTVMATPVPHLIAALTWAKVPGLLVEVVQFVYRYLFVLAEEVLTLRHAAASRGGRGSIIAASSSVTVLFARSYARAEAIHRAMLSRSFSGLLTVPSAARPDMYDGVFVAVTVLSSICSVAAPAVI
jgi:cobalt/nickel transport system permease protein